MSRTRHKRKHPRRDSVAVIASEGTACPTKKMGYASRRDAKQARKRLPQQDLHVFPCPHCPHFHLGAMPPWALAGDAAPVQTARPR